MTFNATKPAIKPLIIPAPAIAGTIGPNTPETVSINKDTTPFFSPSLRSLVSSNPNSFAIGAK